MDDIAVIEITELKDVVPLLNDCYVRLDEVRIEGTTMRCPSSIPTYSE
jgi:hypothetical protein